MIKGRLLVLNSGAETGIICTTSYRPEVFGEISKLRQER